MTSEIQRFLTSVEKLGHKLSADSIIKAQEGNESASIGISNLLMFLGSIELWKDRNILRFRKT